MPPWMTSGAVMWIGIVLIVLIGHYFGYKRRESRDRMLEKIAEHGQSLSPAVTAELLSEGKDRKITVSFILIGIGIALALFFWGMAGGSGLFTGEPGVPNWLPAIGLFPFAVGVAKLFGALADRRSEENRRVRSDK